MTRGCFVTWTYVLSEVRNLLFDKILKIKPLSSLKSILNMMFPSPGKYHGFSSSKENPLSFEKLHIPFKGMKEDLTKVE